jgi:hypothetical protein
VLSGKPARQASRVCAGVGETGAGIEVSVTPDERTRHALKAAVRWARGRAADPPDTLVVDRGRSA